MQTTTLELYKVSGYTKDADAGLYLQVAATSPELALEAVREAKGPFKLFKLERTAGIIVVLPEEV